MQVEIRILRDFQRSRSQYLPSPGLHQRETKGYAETAPRKSTKQLSSLPAIAIADFDRVDLAALTPMNFRVPEAFHREFKLYAVQHGVSMGDLLQESFRVLKEVRGR